MITLFKRCIQRQLVRVTFLTLLDRSRLVFVDSESQAQAMLILKDLYQCPLILNSTLVLVLFSYLITSDLWVTVGPTALLTFELIPDDHDIVHVSCFTVLLAAVETTPVLCFSRHTHQLLKPALEPCMKHGLGDDKNSTCNSRPSI